MWLFRLIRRGMTALWRGGVVPRRETPYFTEASLLFFLSPHLLTSEHAGRLPQPYREHVWVYACANAIAQSISAGPLLLKTGSRQDSTAKSSGSYSVKTLCSPKWPSLSICFGARCCALSKGVASERNLIIPPSAPYRETGTNWWTQPGSSGPWGRR